MRLLLAKDVDVNLQDSNGNTVMHMLVIHAKKVYHSDLNNNTVPHMLFIQAKKILYLHHYPHACYLCQKGIKHS